MVAVGHVCDVIHVKALRLKNRRNKIHVLCLGMAVYILPQFIYHHNYNIFIFVLAVRELVIVMMWVEMAVAQSDI